jgi:hypothetical protein
MDSPKVRSTKRGLADELQESPSAKRARRAKNTKRRHSKGPKGPKDDKDSDGYVEQQDWVNLDNIGRSPTARKETPIKPPTLPFLLKKARKARVSADLMIPMKDNSEKTETTKNGAKTKKDAKESAMDLTAQDSSKTEANTRKTRAEPDLTGEPKHPITNRNSTAPTIAGPSKPRVKKHTHEPKELTPLSDLDPPIDYTFSSFPNPPMIQFPAKKDTKKESAKKPKADSKREEPKRSSKKHSPKTAPAPTPMALNPDMDTDMDIDIDPPSPKEETALTTPSGTKTLKAINKHLKALEAKLTTTTAPSSSPNQNQVTQELAALRSAMTQLHARLECDELRASIRHSMLFNALVKVSTDVGVLGGLVQEVQQQQQLVVDGQGQGQNDGSDADGENNTTTTNNGSTGVNGTPRSAVNGTPRAGASAAAAAAKDKRGKMMRQSRKTYERCLEIYTGDMNRAGDREKVGKYGELCVKYAGDLFKTLG